MADSASDSPPIDYSRPLTNATLTIRLIRNFPYRTHKNLVLHNLDLTTLTVASLKSQVLSHVSTAPGWKAYRTFPGDTMKLYTKAQGTKTGNLIINMEDKETEVNMFKDEEKTLAEYGCEHETEISFFVREDYEEFKKNPVEKW